MDSTIQIAKPQDAEEIYNLLQRAYAALLDLNVNFTITRAPLEVVQKAIRDETVLVLRQQGEAIATVTVRLPQGDNPPGLPALPFIHWFAVAPEYKRQGFGDQILTWAEKNLLTEKLNASAVYLATAIKHPWLTQLYQKRGYQSFHHKVNPLGEELVYLKKDLLPLN
ncbi:GNAT family N-acetyltransferase [Erwiniaceae bacterium BAC15a-03b]|uniref:GNAT family N-acetyltransferase n=1 Tax=Winslowiella arboricola TaxID=2978220 RepID=A0A9J6PKR6_9GAMM|nr:GNAT family N-acetyltransferase [Winslowiella arboricola]MCU5774358.1 GNAT family N-acetyltransferase [Winslowiella arboricola]MCU5778905.1 GNAT family N-acetyltransferase [Winslowiella arboricola]